MPAGSCCAGWSRWDASSSPVSGRTSPYPDTLGEQLCRNSERQVTGAIRSHRKLLYESVLTGGSRAQGSGAGAKAWGQSVQIWYGGFHGQPYHTSLASTREENYFGKFARAEPGTEHRFDDLVSQDLRENGDGKICCIASLRWSYVQVRKWPNFSVPTCASGCGLRYPGRQLSGRSRTVDPTTVHRQKTRAPERRFLFSGALIHVRLLQHVAASARRRP